jgi:hypothetical protein
VTHYNIRGKVKSTAKSGFAQNNKGGHSILTVHQNVAVVFDGIDVDGLVEKSQKAASVGIFPIAVLLVGPLYISGEIAQIDIRLYRQPVKAGHSYGHCIDF